VSADLIEKLPAILAAHAKWTQGTAGGERAYLADANLAGAYLADAYLADANLARANLAGAYLADANLAGANLADAYLADANLARANLTRADLARANLAGANLAGAYLALADLAGADLARANLAGADLARANLAGANLAGANLAGAKNLPFGPVTLPDGAFRAYKACRAHGQKVIVALEIPADAERVAPLVGRKCRASRAVVVDLSSGDEAVSWHTPPEGTPITYRRGETVTPHGFDPDIRVECSAGIHFFLSRREAEEYGP